MPNCNFELPSRLAIAMVTVVIWRAAATRESASKETAFRHMIILKERRHSLVA